MTTLITQMDDYDPAPTSRAHDDILDALAMGINLAGSLLQSPYTIDNTGNIHEIDESGVPGSHIYWRLSVSKTLEQIHANLKYGSKLRDKLSEHLQSRLKMSRDKMSTRYKAMAESEELYAAYVSADDLDTAKENKKKDGGEQTFTTINVPLRMRSQ